MQFISLNYWAVLCVGILSMVLGMLWYSPILFGKPWAKMMGFDKMGKAEMEAMKKKMGPSYFITFLSALVMGFVLAHVVYLAGGFFLGLPVPLPLSEFMAIPQTRPTLLSLVMLGKTVGFLCWLGFVVPPTLSSVLWGGKSLKLWMIDVGYYLVLIELSAILLAVWM